MSYGHLNVKTRCMTMHITYSDVPNKFMAVDWRSADVIVHYVILHSILISRDDRHVSISGSDGRGGGGGCER